MSHGQALCPVSPIARAVGVGFKHPPGADPRFDSRLTSHRGWLPPGDDQPRLEPNLRCGRKRHRILLTAAGQAEELGKSVSPSGMIWAREGMEAPGRGQTSQGLGPGLFGESGCRCPHGT
ncbi:Krueppel-like factor 5 [Platysternon megacephalum]|uniref:Krueppel-like factor 5 n=1 Tax=Platysternon megacephalum TaxID=55544 RepID=A0A4D9E4G1_9SAUR|nr:Krueppel-like factor 5 [Platysternon megacephalum]